MDVVDGGRKEEAAGEVVVAVVEVMEGEEMGGEAAIVGCGQRS